MTLSVDDLTYATGRQDDRPFAAPSGARRRVRRGRLPSGGRVRRRVGLRPAGRRPPRGGHPGRAPSHGRHDDRLPARQPPDRHEGLRVRAAPSATARRELDMVLQIGALKSGRDAEVEADIAAVVERRPRGRRDRQGHLRERLPDRRREDPRLPHHRGRGRRLRQDIDRLRADRRDPRRPDADASPTASPHIRVKAAGGVRTLDALLEVMALGVTRVGATATKTILDDFRARKAGRCRASASAAAGGSRAATEVPDTVGIGMLGLGVHRRVPHARGCATCRRRASSRPTAATASAARRSRAATVSPGRTTRSRRCAPTRRSTSSSSRSRTSSTSRRSAPRPPRQGRRLHEAARPQRRGGAEMVRLVTDGRRLARLPRERRSSTPRSCGCARWSSPARSARLSTFRAREGHSGPHAAHFWDAETAGGGALLDMASHGIEAARYLFGKDQRRPRCVRLGRHARPSRTDDRRGQRGDAHAVRGRPRRDDRRLVVEQGRPRGPVRG